MHTTGPWWKKCCGRCTTRWAFAKASSQHVCLVSRLTRPLFSLVHVIPGRARRSARRGISINPEVRVIFTSLMHGGRWVTLLHLLPAPEMTQSGKHLSGPETFNTASWFKGTTFVPLQCTDLRSEGPMFFSFFSSSFEGFRSVACLTVPQNYNSSEKQPI